MNKVVLIGTLHPIQRDKSNVEFPAFIRQSIDKYEISIVAEEIDISDSVISDLSNSLGLDYRIIEPNEEERAKLGIKSIRNIEHDIFMKYDDDDSPEALADCEARKQSGYRAREAEWLSRIKKITKSPILVVCGSAHVPHFSKLLMENSFEVIVESTHWE